MATLPPLQARHRVDDAVVRIPAVEPGPAALGLLVAAVVFVFDQATKTAADTLLVQNRLIEIFPDWVPYLGDGFGWQLIYNPGGALGFAPAFFGRWFFVIVTLAVTVIVAVNLPRAATHRMGLSYGLLLSGAWGNGIDRVLRPPYFPEGQVVDFIATRAPSWMGLDQPALARFNVADVAILVGFVLLFVSVSRSGGTHAHHEALPMDDR